MSYKHTPRLHFYNIESYSPCIESASSGGKSLSNSSDFSGQPRSWFCGLLWRAFPSNSENELANKAARVLDVTPRQVRNWLRQENDASLKHVAAVLAVAGAEIVFKRIEGESE